MKHRSATQSEKRRRTVQSSAVTFLNAAPLSKGVALFVSVVFLALVLLATAQAAHALTIGFQWQPNQEADIAGYKVYFGNDTRSYTGNIDVGNVTSYTVTGLDDSRRYYFVTSAYYRSGSESDFSNEVSYPPAADGSQASSALMVTEAKAESGGGGGGGCFIATAIFGPQSPEVSVLRQFRDNHLIGNRVGRAFVAMYYRLSPPIARAIEGSPTLRAVGRWVLTPIVYAVDHLYTLLSIVGMAVFIAVRRIRHDGRGAKKN